MGLSLWGCFSGPHPPDLSPGDRALRSAFVRLSQVGGSEQTPGLPSQPHRNSNNNGFCFVSVEELTQHGAFSLTLSSVSPTTAGLQEALGGHSPGRWGARCEPRTLASPLQALPLLRAPCGPFPYEAFLLPPLDSSAGLANMRACSPGPSESMCCEMLVACPPP